MPLDYLSATRSRLPRLRDVPSILQPMFTPIRVLYLVVLTALLWALSSSLHISHQNLEKFYCFGPPMSPMDMVGDAYAKWHRGSASKIMFNTHATLDVSNTDSISFFDMNPIQSSFDGANRHERVILLSPLKDSASFLPKYFELLGTFTYPHNLIDLAFLVSDSSDNTMKVLTAELEKIQSSGKSYHRVTVIEKDFDFPADSMDTDERGEYEHQVDRRKAMARARNYLLASALRPEHAWVIWSDVDILDTPKSLVEDLIRHDKDIIVPNVWVHKQENGKEVTGRVDFNTWVESSQAINLANALPKDSIIVEGYNEFKTGRRFMCNMGDPEDDRHDEIDLDGIGGVTIAVKADVHRSGINFPPYAFENHCESEGFAKMAKRAGYRVVGLPNYVVWHSDRDFKPKVPKKKVHPVKEEGTEKPTDEKPKDEKKEDPKGEKKEEKKEESKEENKHDTKEEKPIEKTANEKPKEGEFKDTKDETKDKHKQ